MEKAFQDSQQSIISLSVEEIENELAELRAIKKKAESYDTTDFASQITLKSLDKREEQLLEELRLVKDKSENKTKKNSVLKSQNKVIQLFKDCYEKNEYQQNEENLKRLDAAAKKYTNRLESYYNSIRIFGMSAPVPLRDIFVRVNVLDKLNSLCSVTVKELEGIFDRDKRGFGHIKKTKPGLDIVNEKQKLIVLGKPGAGKTTFLRRIALMALDGELDKNLIPVFINLCHWIDSGKLLLDYIIEEFDICNLPQANTYIEQMLDNGKFLLLLDGFDEVTGDVQLAAKKIRDFSDEYIENQYVISCRIGAWNYVFEHFTDIEIADFNDEQIKSFVDNWFGRQTKKSKLCWIKLEENKSIKELASTPLLLTMLCLAFDVTMDFPPNRAELYKEAIDALLKTWDSSKSIKRNEVYYLLSSKRKVSMLSRIAAQTFEEGQYFIKKEQLEKYISNYICNLPDVKEESIEFDSHAVLKSIESNHGLLVERAKDIYSFSHLVVQEYFTADYIIENRNHGSLIKLINNYLYDYKWQEIILLISEMLGDADQYLLSIRKNISSITDDNQLKFFKILDECVMPEAKYPHNLCKVLCLYFALDYARDHIQTSNIESIRKYAHSLASSLKLYLYLDIDLASILNLDFNLIKNFSKDISNNMITSLKSYLYGTKLMVDCMNTDIYISKEVRQKLLDSILVEPWEGIEGI